MGLIDISMPVSLESDLGADAPASAGTGSYGVLASLGTKADLDAAMIADCDQGEDILAFGKVFQNVTLIVAFFGARTDTGLRPLVSWSFGNHRV